MFVVLFARRADNCIPHSSFLFLLPLPLRHTFLTCIYSVLDAMVLLVMTAAAESPCMHTCFTFFKEGTHSRESA